MSERDGPVAGIDLGGTKVRVGIVDREGRVLRAESRPSEAESGPEAILARMVEFVRELAGPVRLSAVGLGVAGPFDVARGVTTEGPNLPGWEEFPVRQRLHDALGLPAAAGNDASVAALAEFRYGAGRDAGSMVYISLGTGIGGGIVADGKLQNGATGGAGELGHMVLDPLGPACGCGRRGCLEAFASGGGIERQAAAGLAGGVASSLQQLVRAGRAVTMHEIDAAARAGDAFARGLVDQAADHLAWGIMNLAHLLNPELIIFGGGLLAVRDLLIDPAIALAGQRTFHQHWRDLRFATAVLEEDAGVLGAAAIAYDLLQEQ